MKPQAFTEFQPLEEVLVGRSYDTRFFDYLNVPFTPETKRLMTYLLDETEEDYQFLIKTLNQLGVKVHRPHEDAYIESYNQYKGGLQSFTSAYLMNPRDDQIVIHNKIIMGQAHSGIGRGYATGLEDYKDHFLNDPIFSGLNGASIVRLGEDIIIDENPYSDTYAHTKRLRQYIEPLGYRIHHCKTHDFEFKNAMSHSDAVFAILRPGLILHAKNNTAYSEGLFPDWDLLEVEKEYVDQNNIVFTEFRNTRDGYEEHTSYAFEDSKYNDKEWRNLLNTWFGCLMGYSKETFFDVNCLVIDENNVIFSGENPPLFRQLEKYKINPIVCPWRHRLFWDGGIHCATLDLKRKGSRERYL